jgi:hypothetical protein
MRVPGSVSGSGSAGGRRLLGAGLSLALVVAGAGAAAGERDQPETTRPFTLGLVQKALRPGLAQADVAERLGAPNIVTRGAEAREVWVYDKVSSDIEASSGGVGVGGAGTGAGSTFWGLLGVGAGKRSERVKSSQRTLTVVVRFSAEGTVEGFTWHSSAF